jgi:hypothetical protein
MPGQAPYAMPYGPPGVAQPPYGGYPVVAAPAKKKTGLMIGIIALVVVLLVGGTTTAVLLARGGQKQSTPTNVLTAYLEAVAAGKAEEALNYFLNPPTDRSFLTDEVLAYSKQLAPITDISVEEGYSSDRSSTDWISFSYRIGTFVVTDSALMQKFDGKWFIDDSLPTIDLEYRAEMGIGMTLNGVATDGIERSYRGSPVFPGTYEFKITHPMFEIQGISQFKVGRWVEDSDLEWDFVVLKESAVAKLDAAAKKALDACLALQTVESPQCGFDPIKLEGGATPDLTTVRHELTSGNLNDLSWRPDYSNLLSIKAYVFLRVTTTLNDTNGKSYKSNEYVSGVQIDVSDAENLVVTFGG